jgi:hypothetical protein
MTLHLPSHSDSDRPLSAENRLKMSESIVGSDEISAPGAAGPVPLGDTRCISVDRADGISALDQWAPYIDRLNLATARPNPFQSSAFLRCYASHTDYFVPGREECLYLIREGGDLIGCAAMRRSRVRIFGLGPLHLEGVRLQFLAPLDTEHLGILCAPEDADRVAAALMRYLCACERGWGMLEFVGQPPGGPLHKAVHAANGVKFRAREIAENPYNEITLQWGGLAAYFQSLSKKMRSNISRQARRLFAAGEVKLILAEGAAAVTAWFDAYRDLESRSWKNGTASSIERHPRRARFYRELAGGNAGLSPEFIGVVLDGVLIAGLLLGSNTDTSPACHGAWCLEMAYDASRRDLGPGQLLLLVAVGEAINKGHKYLSLMQNFSYYKHRWAAEPIKFVKVELIRRLSLFNLRATVGDLRRRWQRHRPQSSADGDARRQERKRGAALAPAAAERARNVTAIALGYTGAGFRLLNRESAGSYLPFDLAK